MRDVVESAAPAVLPQARPASLSGDLSESLLAHDDAHQAGLEGEASDEAGDEARRGRIGSIECYVELPTAVYAPVAGTGGVTANGAAGAAALASPLAASETMDHVHLRSADGPGRRGPADSAVFIHAVVASDTLGGLELKYGVSASVLRRLNGMVSDRLTAHLHLKIPSGACVWETLTPEMFLDVDAQRLHVLQLFRLHFPSIPASEVEYYTRAANDDVRLAIRQCQEDMDWERDNWESIASRASLSARARKNRALGHKENKDKARGARARLSGFLPWRRQAPPSATA